MQQQPDRQALAAEVLEMGEQLFALALLGQASESQPQPGEESPASPIPLAELEAASREFFTALRLLLDIPQF